MAPEEGYDPPSTVVNSHPSLPFDYSGMVEKPGTAPGASILQGSTAPLCFPQLVPCA